ncbi:bifunctional 3-(3-hydroxy-phenyl)propionate/3-hydroxycinnamic acid hydroxylase [Sphingobium sp. MK2]|uniref:bifunctional 3-(3-hydroxy-phenyl)propionate/3-hydroxycinnamic acid hydroxylase MhpA n=1 Tax=Sphingobium sp. MK2 TaxID=3116540 RepID=UPI0032E35F8C
MSRDHDVVIVGAGPVGLVLAHLLARQGLDVGVFEKWYKPYGLPRAVGLAHDSMRVLQATGVLPDLMEHIELQFRKSVAEYFTADGEVLVRFEFPGVDHSGFPSMVPFDQPGFEEAILAAADAEPRITIHRGWAASALRQTADQAFVKLDPVDGENPRDGEAIEVAARYVVGCDGGNSTVRRLIDAPMTDTGFTSEWMVVDIRPSDELAARLPFGQSLDWRRPTTLVPSGPGRRRFEFIALPGETAEDLGAPEKVWALLADWDVTPKNAELVRSAVYRFHARWANDWRHGRVLLCGDAAHQTPPFLGQGFNSGMRDAIALAWRLALVEKGDASPTLLDSYSSERVPHVATVIQQAVGIGHMISIINEQQAMGRDAQLRAMRENPPEEPFLAPWRLGPGLGRDGDPEVRELALQARVSRDGVSGLLDDVIGSGRFILLSRGVDPVATMSSTTQDLWRRLGGQIVVFGAETEDSEGAYERWFDSLGVDLVLVRPDFYIFAAGKVNEADAMVVELTIQLGLAVEAA